MKIKRIFILGHMRSRSTLLCHLLMNDKNIFGLGESNKVYRTKLDLVKMRIKTRLNHNGILPFNFIFLDQINHNNKTPNLDLIKSNAKILILVREPNETFESIRVLTKTFYEEWSHERIEEYYMNRLNYLSQVKSSLSASHSLTIDSEHIISHSQKCLNEISDFLNLQTPLTSDYGIQKFTGRHGDPSPNISTGKILQMKSGVYENEIRKECFRLYEDIVN